MRIGIEGADGSTELLGDPAKECLHTTFLRGSHRLGNLEIGKADQCLPDVLQAFLAVDEGRRGGRAGVWLRAQKIHGSFQESTAVLFIRHPVGADQSESFAVLQAMATDAGKKGILFGGGHSAQGVSHGRAESSRGQRVLRCGGKTLRDLQTAGDPLGFSVEHSRDRGGAQSILVNQGIDHTRLVECSEGTGGGIGR